MNNYAIIFSDIYIYIYIYIYNKYPIILVSLIPKYLNNLIELFNEELIVNDLLISKYLVRQ